MAGSRANWEDMVMPTLIARDKEVIARRRKAEADEASKPKPAAKAKAEGKNTVDTIKDYRERQRKAMDEY